MTFNDPCSIFIAYLFLQTLCGLLDFIYVPLLFPSSSPLFLAYPVTPSNPYHSFHTHTRTHTHVHTHRHAILFSQRILISEGWGSTATILRTGRTSLQAPWKPFLTVKWKKKKKRRKKKTEEEEPQKSSPKVRTHHIIVVLRKLYFLQTVGLFICYIFLLKVIFSLHPFSFSFSSSFSTSYYSFT